jgi:DNA-binding transcriptional regulator YdaS (Cro superfamily)
MDAIDMLREAGWGPVRLSKELGIKPQAVSQWKQVPADRVLEVERLTKISRHQLRPDVFGERESVA